MIDRIIARRDAQPNLDKAQMTRRIYRLIRLQGEVNASRKPKALQLIKNCLIYMEEVIHRMTSAYYNSALGEEEQNKSTFTFCLLTLHIVMWTNNPIYWLLDLGWNRNLFTIWRKSATKHFLFIDPRLCEPREDVVLKEAILELLKHFVGVPQNPSVNDVIEYLQRLETGSYHTSYVPIPATKALAWKPVAEAFLIGQNSYSDVVKLILEYFGDGTFDAPAEFKSNAPTLISNREEKNLPPVSLPVRPVNSQTFFKYSGDISTLNKAFARLSDNISSTHLNLTETISIMYRWLQAANLYMKHNWQSFRNIEREGLYETIAVENFRIGTGEFTFTLEAEGQNFMTLKIFADTRPLKVIEEIQKTLEIIAKHAYVPEVLKQQADQLIGLVDVFLKPLAKKFSNGEEVNIPAYKPYS